MHLIYLSFNIFCIFEKTYVNISILLTFNLLAVNLMSLVIFRTCYIRPPALAGESMNSDLSVHSSIFMSVFDTVFSELDQEFFLLFFTKLRSEKFCHCVSLDLVQSKNYIYCYVPAQIPYLRKIWLLRYGSKCS